MRTRLNKIQQAAGARDDEYLARRWLINVFHNLVRDALIDGKTSVQIAILGTDGLRSEEKKLLAELGYSVTQSVKCFIEGGSETIAVISWKDTE